MNLFRRRFTRTSDHAFGVRISDEERGTEGFGYDSLFVPDDGDGRTFGEHAAVEKNAMSHRSRACQALLDALS